ncbi:Acg family FMN-binding oxidoreductase [Streptomyces sp. NPDC002851]
MSAQPLDPTTVTALVANAAAAPSLHNAQPWTFRFHSGSRTFHVRADLERAMQHADPSTRGLHIGCGAALFNLRVAAADAGWEPTTRLLPDPADPGLLATVELVGPTLPETDLAPLHPAIARRHTSRAPFSDEELPEEIQDGLRGAAVAEGARLVFPDPWHVEEILDLVHDAEARDTLDAPGPGVDEDTARWTHTGTSSDTEGIPAYAFGPTQRDGRAPVRDFAGRRPMPHREKATFEKEPHLALLGTAEDQPRDWLIAGQALERVLLQATLDGLATSLTSHALEWPELRWAVRDPLSSMGYVQMVLRLGYVDPRYGEKSPATPRRPVGEVLDVLDIS